METYHLVCHSMPRHIHRTHMILNKSYGTILFCECCPCNVSFCAAHSGSGRPHQGQAVLCRGRLEVTVTPGHCRSAFLLLQNSRSEIKKNRCTSKGKGACKGALLKRLLSFLFLISNVRLCGRDVSGSHDFTALRSIAEVLATQRRLVNQKEQSRIITLTH